jgi:hypothetical protein
MSTGKIKKDSIRTQINKIKMLKHLKQSLGNVRAACAGSGTKKSTFYDWLKKDEDYKKAVLNIYRAGEDFAIDVIMELIGDNVDELLKVQRRNNKKLNNLL